MRFKVYVISIVRKVNDLILHYVVTYRTSITISTYNSIHSITNRNTTCTMYTEKLLRIYIVHVQFFYDKVNQYVRSEAFQVSYFNRIAFNVISTTVQVSVSQVNINY